MAAITVVKPSTLGMAGTAVAPAAASAGGDTLSNPRGGCYLKVNNGGGGSINVTIAAGANPTRPADGQFPAMTVGANVVAVANGTNKIIGPIPSCYNDSGGLVQISYSGVTSVTVEAYDPS